MMDRNKLQNAIVALVQSPYGNMAKANGIEIKACVMEVCDGGAEQDKIRYRQARQGEPANLFSLNVHYAAPQEYSVACVADFFDPRTAQAFGVLISNALDIPLQVDPLIRKFDNRTTENAIETLLAGAFEGQLKVCSSAIIPGYHEVYDASSAKLGVRTIDCSMQDSPEFYSVVFTSPQGLRDTFSDCASLDVANAMAQVIEQTHLVRFDCAVPQHHRRVTHNKKPGSSMTSSLMH